MPAPSKVAVRRKFASLTASLVEWEEIVVNGGINPEAILGFIPVGPKP
jgi:hypothetical protein